MVVMKNGAGMDQLKLKIQGKGQKHVGGYSNQAKPVTEHRPIMRCLTFRIWCMQVRSRQENLLTLLNNYSAELICFQRFQLEKEAQIFKCYFKIVLTIVCNNLADSADHDQTARSMQSDLDLHCPQKTT